MQLRLALIKRSPKLDFIQIKECNPSYLAEVLALWQKLFPTSLVLMKS
ncbi:MAG: hypothetical protein KME21_14265 [Desmonostoc vinosum HA7617-LM4]|nr:hypothetical protein [Desmonostoc vinosum HA7617-LM4]